MVIACVLGFERGKLGWFSTDEKSVGQDYERVRLVELGHKRVSFVGAQ